MMEEKVKIRIKEELETAKRRLEAAKLLFEKDMIEDAVNRAYYAFFHAAKAMLNVLGYDAKTHSGLISEFGLRIIKTDRHNIQRRSRDLIKNADEFLKKAKEFIEEKL